MPTFRYAKLVRDKIPGWHIESGHILTRRKLVGPELVAALTDKLHEEADEVSGALDQSELIEELSDVQQIIDDICAVSGISKDEVAAVMAKKAARKGGFLQGEYIETVTMPNNDDEWAAYCRRSPEKYPEIKDAA